MPKSRADVHLGGEWTLTVSGENFFMAEDGRGEDRLIMFAMSKLNIVIIAVRCHHEQQVHDDQAYV